MPRWQMQHRKREGSAPSLGSDQTMIPIPGRNCPRRHCRAKQAEPKSLVANSWRIPIGRTLVVSRAKAYTLQMRKLVFLHPTMLLLSNLMDIETVRMRPLNHPVMLPPTHSKLHNWKSIGETQKDNNNMPDRCTTRTVKDRHQYRNSGMNYYRRNRNKGQWLRRLPQN